MRHSNIVHSYNFWQFQKRVRTLSSLRSIIIKHEKFGGKNCSFKNLHVFSRNVIKISTGNFSFRSQNSFVQSVPGMIFIFNEVSYNYVLSIWCTLVLRMTLSSVKRCYRNHCFELNYVYRFDMKLINFRPYSIS